MKGFRARQNFNAYDPSNSFDPRLAGNFNNAAGDSGSAGSTVQSAKPGQKMQVNLTLTNPAANFLTIELFNYLNSFTRVQQPGYVNPALPNYAYVPLSSYQGIQRLIATTDGTVGFSNTGSLEVRGLPANPVATVGCSEIAYASFFAASGITPFSVLGLRVTYTTDSQIDNNITYIKKSYAGGVVENPISPRSFFQPSQFQDLIVDVAASFDIGIDTGIKYVLNSGETVKFALFINMWTSQTLIM
jgi:hypothetical protein